MATTITTQSTDVKLRFRVFRPFRGRSLSFAYRRDLLGTVGFLPFSMLVAAQARIATDLPM
jgi:hypothetical protein